PDKGKQEQTFSQADVDRIVADRLKRERETTRTKYADYDELKKKAEGSRTLEDRMVEVEKRAETAEAKALRAEIANAHGISAEDRDLFLTGTDEATLTAQAKRLSDRESERKKKGNHVPGEGTQTRPPADEARAAVRQLFGSGG
ncbi:MAG: hypothetical protein J2O47_02920, partial [Acidimicrobiaceae bacterium]|nr:hypothetical protein [Acidimicrobiaceae bacterium]